MSPVALLSGTHSCFKDRRGVDDAEGKELCDINVSTNVGRHKGTGTCRFLSNDEPVICPGPVRVVGGGGEAIGLGSCDIGLDEVEGGRPG